ncbi:RNA polymerase sigma factor [Nocardia otitidiscaviarum]|uniref:RNA polymerase sigma factor n=1 Tax=Nocardia otitidiscaviarum TaxID=1823 RepID=UPI0024550D7B|nr:sigma-70 family RNA polymerase sigma factor [Nocardia otitidiscaviarum]
MAPVDAGRPDPGSDGGGHRPGHASSHGRDGTAKLSGGTRSGPGGRPVGVDTAVAAAVADAHRREWAFVLAATVRVTRDLDLAEECVQDAYAQALTRWTVDGVPAKPGGWLTTAARNRALDLLRRQSTLRRRLPLLVSDEIGADPAEAALAAAEIPDDRLRLICTCCHPALSIEAQVALTLRLVCGLTTAEVARAFLVSESTMAARITRAKKKIAAARIPYRVPAPAELPERIDAVLTVVHLLFTTGHTAPSGDALIRHDLADRATDLARMLRLLLPDNGEVAGLLALILLTDARRDTRVDASGAMVPLADQDRTRWDRTRIAEGLALVRAALSGSPHGTGRRTRNSPDDAHPEPGPPSAPSDRPRPDDTTHPDHADPPAEPHPAPSDRPRPDNATHSDHADPPAGPHPAPSVGAVTGGGSSRHRAGLPPTAPGRYALQAAIAAVHAESPSYADTDWRDILGLYDILIQRWPSPVVALNRAVALGMAEGPAAGVAALEPLTAEPQLAAYPYLPAARAHFLAQLGRTDAARLAYEEAILLADNAPQRRYLAAELARLR